jgi:hypothetical protein
MIRLKPEDFADSQRLQAFARAGNMSESEFVRRFRGSVGAADPKRRARS